MLLKKFLESFEICGEVLLREVYVYMSEVKRVRHADELEDKKLF